ncbi:hypothetical protein [Tropicimonas sp. IMCC6043]|nr:hypothetical protein [Tropicimonas sp. IMCC6043]
MNNRWMESVLEAAEENIVEMPWARGQRRQEMIARRASAEASRKAPRLRA